VCFCRKSILFFDQIKLLVSIRDFFFKNIKKNLDSKLCFCCVCVCVCVCAVVLCLLHLPHLDNCYACFKFYSILSSVLMIINTGRN